MSIKISICIPTFNRSICLKECLYSILSSVSGYEKSVEIIISDNASTDHTTNLVSEFIDEGHRIRYYRNETNIGAENNFYYLITLARGDYIWIIGDDDKMEKGAIQSIMHLINENNDYNLIVTNYSKYSSDFSVRRESSGYAINNSFVINKHDDLMKLFGWRLGYISSVIFKNDKPFLLKSEAYEKYVEFAEYKYSFYYLICHGVICNCNAYYSSSPLIRNRMDNSPIQDPASEDSWNCFVVGISVILDRLKHEGYSRRSINLTKNKMIYYYVIPHVISLKSRGDWSIQKNHELFYNYNNCLLYWLTCVPVVLMPSLIIRMAKKNKRIFRLYNRLKARWSRI